MTTLRRSIAFDLPEVANHQCDCHLKPSSFNGKPKATPYCIRRRLRLAVKRRNRSLRICCGRTAFIAAVCVFLLCGVAPVGADDTFTQAVKPFLAQHCTGCHGAGTQEGEVTLHQIDGDLAAGKDIERWSKVLDQLVLGEMPPNDEPQPSSSDRARVVAWIKGELTERGHEAAGKLSQPGFGNYVSHEVLFGDSPAGPSYSPPRLWRIRPAAYQAAVQDVAKGKYSDPFTLATEGHGFHDFANRYRLAGPDLNQLMANTRVLASLLVEVVTDKNQARRGYRTPEQLYQLIDPANQELTDSQFQAAIDWLHHRILLRDPTDEESKRLIEFARNGIRSHGRLLGVRNMVSAVLLHPEAVYRNEHGAGEPDAHGRLMLSPRELAYALSYALTDTRPDQELLKSMDELSFNRRPNGLRAAAESGVEAHAIHDAQAAGHAVKQAVRDQVERILSDDKIDKPRILEFFREYFEYPAAEDVFKDVELFPAHSAQTLVRDTDHLVMYIYERDEEVLRNLLTTNLSFVYYDEHNGKPTRGRTFKGTSGHVHLSYSLPPDWKWTPQQPIELPGEHRAGILTQPSWLAAKSGNFDNDPIRRGHWIRYKLLGGTIPDVPITVDAQLPNDETLTLREKMQVTREDYCWKCHRKMDPLGLSFEMFDHFGRWRTRELGKRPVTTGAITHSPDSAIEGEVDHALELVRKLAGSDHVRQVFVRHAFRYWMGRNESAVDAATLQRADKDYVESGGSMKALITSLLTSDSFLYRRAVK